MEIGDLYTIILGDETIYKITNYWTDNKNTDVSGVKKYMSETFVDLESIEDPTLIVKNEPYINIQKYIE